MMKLLVLPWLAAVSEATHMGGFDSNVNNHDEKMEEYHDEMQYDNYDGDNEIDEFDPTAEPGDAMMDDVQSENEGPSDHSVSDFGEDHTGSIGHHTYSQEEINEDKEYSNHTAEEVLNLLKKSKNYVDV